MTRAVVLVASGFQDEEYVYPYYRMLEEGWQVDVCTPNGVDAVGKYGVPARANMNVNDLIPKSWDLAWDVVVIPGGFESPDRLRVIPVVQSFVQGMHIAGRVIAAICHGPWVLVSAGICKDQYLMGYKSIEPDIVNAGATYIREPAMAYSYNNIVTSDHYKNNGHWMKLVIDTVAKKDKGQWDERHSSTF